MRRRRCEVSIELRKARRDDQLQKKRNVTALDDTIEEEASLIDATSPAKIINPRDILHGNVSCYCTYFFSIHFFRSHQTQLFSHQQRGQIANFKCRTISQEDSQ